MHLTAAVDEVCGHERMVDQDVERGGGADTVEMMQAAPPGPRTGVGRDGPLGHVELTASPPRSCCHRRGYEGRHPDLHVAGRQCIVRGQSPTHRTVRSDTSVNTCLNDGTVSHLGGLRTVSGQGDEWPLW